MCEANWERAPLGWQRPSDETMASARQATLDALTMLGLGAADGRLVTYYDPGSDQPGTSFTDVEPVWPDRFTAADLYAAGLMGAQVHAGAGRRLIEIGPDAQVCRLLQGIPFEWTLRTAGPAQLTRMAELHRELKVVLTSDGTRGDEWWAAASALCARKRPELFPVRAAGVRRLLGVWSFDDFRVDWQVYRSLLQDSEVERALATVVASARGVRRPLRVDASSLRLLDVVLCTDVGARHVPQSGA